MFTLLSVVIEHKGTTLYDCTFSKSANDDRRSALTTLVIGENGTGKSYLLAVVAELQRSIHDIKSKNKISTTSFRYDNVKITFAIGKKIYAIKRERNFSYWECNNVAILPEEAVFPSKILAISFMVNDKFSYGNDGFYEYLGVRAAANATYTSSIQKKVFSSILSCLENDHKLSSLKLVLKYLNFSNKMTLKFYIKRKTLFSRRISNKSIFRSIENIKKSSRSISERKLELLQLDADNIVQFICELKKLAVISDNHITYETNLDTGDLNKNKLCS